MPATLPADLTDDVRDGVANVLLAAAAAAARETLPRFRTPLAIDNKLADGFDPVTEADRAAETVIRDTIADQFPDHRIIGEEWGQSGLGGDFAWIIDPIDGTRAYIAGIPVWGTLIGVTWRGRAIAGIMDQPFTGETFLADGQQARYRRTGDWQPMATSGVRKLANARLFTTAPGLFPTPKRAAYDALEHAALQYRYGCDCYAFAMLAAGHADLVVEAGLQSYDIAALIPLIEQAGGVITTWQGGRAEAGGDVIAAATPALHKQAMAVLAGK